MPQIEDSNDANKQKGAVTELRLLRAYSKNRRFIRSTAQIMQLMRGTAFDKKAVSMHQNQKIPDKVSRRSTALVRHFIQDKKARLFQSPSCLIFEFCDSFVNVDQIPGKIKESNRIHQMILRMNGQKRNIHMIALCFLRQHPSLGIVCFDKGLIGIFQFGLGTFKVAVFCACDCFNCKGFGIPGVDDQPHRNLNLFFFSNLSNRPLFHQINCLLEHLRTVHHAICRHVDYG